MTLMLDGVRLVDAIEGPVIFLCLTYLYGVWKA